MTVRVAGEELFHSRIPGEYAALRKLLHRFVEYQILVAYEAGPCGFGLHDRLQAVGARSRQISGFDPATCGFKGSLGIVSNTMISRLVSRFYLRNSEFVPFNLVESGRSISVLWVGF